MQRKSQFVSNYSEHIAEHGIRACTLPSRKTAVAHTKAQAASASMFLQCQLEKRRSALGISNPSAFTTLIVIQAQNSYLVFTSLCNGETKWINHVKSAVPFPGLSGPLQHTGQLGEEWSSASHLSLITAHPVVRGNKWLSGHSCFTLCFPSMGRSSCRTGVT